MSMRVETSSVDQVRKRFETNKKKQEEKKKDYDIELRMKELKEEVNWQKLFFHNIYSLPNYPPLIKPDNLY